MSLIKCAQCGLNNPSSQSICERCGSSLVDVPKVETQSTISTAYGQPVGQMMTDPQERTSGISHKYLLGIIGSTILFIGVFTPILSLPIVGSMNYFQNGRGDGVIVAVLAVISLILTLARKYRWLLLTGIISIAILAFTFINFQLRMSEMRAQMDKQLANNPFKGIGEMMFNSIQIQWGWAVLLVGSVILIVAGALKDKTDNDALSVTSISGGLEPQSATDMGNQADSFSILNSGYQTESQSGWSNKIILAAIGATILAGGVVYYFALAQGSEQSSLFGKPSPQATPTPKANSQQKAMSDALSVTVTNKGFQKADFMRGIYQDYITLQFSYTNHSSKDIKGFKGTVVFTDMFGDKVQSNQLKEDKVLKAGETIKVDRTLDYNQFMAEHQKLRDAALENLKVEWLPDTIMFTDGAILKSDNQ